jgi:putative inorganic carbon (HCO3(-)) transporter
MRVLVVGVFLLPLVVFPALDDELVLPKLLVSRALVLILAALWILESASRGSIAIRRTPLDVPLLAFAGSAVLSTVLAVNPNVAVFGTYGRYEGLLTLLTYIALFWLSAQTVQQPGDIVVLRRSVLASAYLISLLGIVLSTLTTAAAGGHPGETAVTYGGFFRAQSTFGNAYLLGAFLAIMMPLAFAELRAAHGPGHFLLALNVLVILSLALGLTFSRSAWAGVAVAAALAFALHVPRLRIRAWVAGTAVVLLVAILAATALAHANTLIGSVISRAASLAAPGAGSGATRLHLWSDTLRLIGSRPVTGYGPDTFGLVFPSFQSGNWTPGVLIDKAHADVLQVAATQGLIGVAAYAAVQIAFIIAFWRGRHHDGAMSMFAAWVAYQVAVLANFSWLPAAAPFWVLAGASVVTWQGFQRPAVHSWPAPTRVPVAVLAAFVAVAFTIFAIARPAAADADYLDAVNARRAGDIGHARQAIASAMDLAPEQSVYAAEAGDLALGLHGETVGPQPDLSTAIEAYERAARLGSFNPVVFRHLAIADHALGRQAAAIAAARHAVQLSPFDPANLLLLQQLTGG